MRKFFLGAALVAASFGMAQSADAATVDGCRWCKYRIGNQRLRRYL